MEGESLSPVVDQSAIKLLSSRSYIVDGSNFCRERKEKEDRGKEVDMSPSSVSTVETDHLPDSSIPEDSEFLGDSFLAQCFESLDTSESLSSSGDEEYVPNSLDDFRFLENKSIASEEGLSFSPNQRNFSTDSLSSLAINSPDIRPVPSPAHGNFLSLLGIDINDNKWEYPEIELAKRAHRQLKRRSPRFLAINLAERKSKKETKQSHAKEGETSFLGMFLRRMTAWRSGEQIDPLAIEAPSLTVDDSEETVVPPLERKSSSVFNFVQAESKKTDVEEVKGPELGLERSSVARLENYDKDLRKRAQDSFLGGKRNVAFVDKVQIMEIHGRKMLPKSVRDRMFYTKSQFFKMIANNMKEVELDARRKRKKKAKKSESS